MSSKLVVEVHWSVAIQAAVEAIVLGNSYVQ